MLSAKEAMLFLPSRNLKAQENLLKEVRMERGLDIGEGQGPGERRVVLRGSSHSGHKHRICSQGGLDPKPGPSMY